MSAGHTTGGRGGRHPRRRAWPAATARAAVVLAVAAAGYVVVVPTSPVQRSRLALLVSRTSGVAAFPGPPLRAVEQPVSSSGLPTLAHAARGHAAQAGIWVQAWQGKASTGTAAVAFMAPSTADASKVRPQLAAMAMGANSYGAEGLRRTATWSVPGVAGSAGATYSPAPRVPGKGAPTQSIGEVLWTSGRVVELVEVATGSGDPRPDATAAAVHQAAHLAATEPGFTLSPTRYPPLATGLWAGGAALLALLAGLGPLGVRRRRERLAAEEAARAARTVKVGGQVIVRNRRGA